MNIDDSEHQMDDLELDYDQDEVPMDPHHQSDRHEEESSSYSVAPGKDFKAAIQKMDKDGAEYWSNDLLTYQNSNQADNALEVLKDLSVNSTHTRASVKVIGIRDFSDFEIQRIFSRYHASNAHCIDKDVAIVQFPSSTQALQMFQHMTSRLRFHDVGTAKRPAEEGEVSDDDEDEGEIMMEEGKETVYVVDDVALVVDEDEVRLDSARFCVPVGEWRAVVRHVPQNKILLIRYATKEEVKSAGLSVSKRQKAEEKETVDKDGFEYKWSNDKPKVRPGLGIYDSKGKELEWDFEHDTRFYDDKKGKKEEAAVEEKEEEDDWRAASKLKFSGAVKVRGRGAKRFLDEEADTLSCDREVEPKKQRKETNDEDERDWRADPTPEPSDQPWNKKGKFAGRLTRP